MTLSKAGHSDFISAFLEAETEAAINSLTDKENGVSSAGSLIFPRLQLVIAAKASVSWKLEFCT